MDSPDKELKKGVGIDERAPERNHISIGNSWFFGIGIDHYQSFSPLNNAVKDVKDIHDLLVKKYDIDPSKVILLFNEEASREGILEKFDYLSKKVEEDDKLIIYYSGHGHRDSETHRGFWVPQNVEKGKNHEYIRNSTIQDYIQDISSLHTLLISDNCFSGTLIKRGSQQVEKAMEELESIPSRWAICSGRHDEEVVDGKPGKNSPFAASILKILRRNEDPAFNVAALADEVWKQTQFNYTQMPEGSPLFSVGHEGGQYIFRLRNYKLALEQGKQIDEFQESLVDEIHKAVVTLQVAYQENKWLETNQLRSLARPFKRVAPTLHSLNILDELFEKGDDASIFAAATILHVRRDPSYFQKLAPYIDKGEMRGSANWRVLRAIRDMISYYQFSKSEREELTAQLRRAAVQRHTIRGPIFGTGTTLNLIRQICRYLGVAKEDVFTEEQLKASA